MALLLLASAPLGKRRRICNTSLHLLKAHVLGGSRDAGEEIVESQFKDSVGNLLSQLLSIVTLRVVLMM